MTGFVVLAAVIGLAALVGASIGADRSGSWSLAHFTAYVAACVRRNLPLGSSISAYAGDLPAGARGVRRALLGIADAVDNGVPLADAMDRRPAALPGWYRALVRAGERGGNLARVLDRLGETAELDSRDAQRLAEQATYPAALAAMAVFMLTMVAGRFMIVLRSMAGSESQASFARLAFAGRALAGVALVVFGLAAVAAFAGTGPARRLCRWFPALARAWSWLAWHAPLVSRCARRRAVSQYALAAGELMEAGLSDHEALATAAGAGGNSHFEAMARAAAASVTEGAKLSDALSRADVRRELPSELAWYVRTGEASERLPEALARASEAAAGRSRSALSHLVTLVMPAGLVVVALAIATQTYAVFSAIGRCNAAVRESAASGGGAGFDVTASEGVAPSKPRAPSKKKRRRRPPTGARRGRTRASAPSAPSPDGPSAPPAPSQDETPAGPGD